MARTTANKKGTKTRVWTEQERLLVIFMSVAGIDQNRIAKAINTDKKTLGKHFREALDSAADTHNTKVVGALYKNAIEGNVSAQIFWCKTRLGWREKTDIELSGKDGTPLAAVIRIIGSDKPNA